MKKKIKNKKYIFVFIIIGLAMIFLFVFTNQKLKSFDESSEIKKPTILVKKSNIVSSADLSGYICTDPHINLLSEVTGEIEKVYTKEGDTVEKDQAIFDIKLSKVIYGYPKIITIKSPIKGRVLLLSVSEGDTVFPRTILGVIGGNNFIAKFYANEIDAVNIKNGQNATLSFEAYPNKEINSTVSSISYTTVRMEQGIKAYLVIIKIPEQEYPYMRDGLSVNAKIITLKRKGVLVVPIESVGYDESGRFVDLVTNEGKIKKVYVKTGISSDNFTEILSGVKEGDRILETPLDNVFKNIGVKAPFGMLNHNGD